MQNVSEGIVSGAVSSLFTEKQEALSGTLEGGHVPRGLWLRLQLCGPVIWDAHCTDRLEHW